MLSALRLKTQSAYFPKPHLFLEWLDVVEVDMGVAQCVDKVPRLVSGRGEGGSMIKQNYKTTIILNSWPQLRGQLYMYICQVLCTAIHVATATANDNRLRRNSF